MWHGAFGVAAFRLGGAPTPGVEPAPEVGTPALGADGPLRGGKVVFSGRNDSIAEDADQRVHDGLWVKLFLETIPHIWP